MDQKNKTEEECEGFVKAISKNKKNKKSVYGVESQLEKMKEKRM
jgi:hypothetical protein